MAPITDGTVQFIVTKSGGGGIARNCNSVLRDV